MSEVDLSTLRSCYEKYQILKQSMSTANKKYRSTENGRLKSKINQQKWMESKKGDDIFRQNMNENQRLRYRKRMDAKKRQQKLKQQRLFSNNRLYI